MINVIGEELPLRIATKHEMGSARTLINSASTLTNSVRTLTTSVRTLTTSASPRDCAHHKPRKKRPRHKWS